MVTYSAGAPLIVSDHAMWRAAERFRGFDTVTIEDEVRDALKAGRVTTDRRAFGCGAGSDPDCLYVATPDHRRVYVLREDRDVPGAFVIITTMRGGAARIVSNR